MSVTKYIIHVENNSDATQTFFLFQQPADYVGGSKIYSNAVGSITMDNTGGDQGRFEADVLYHAGAALQTAPPAVGKISASMISTVPINLLTDKNPSGKADQTEVSFHPDGNAELSEPMDNPDIEKGSFRISTPPYNPEEHTYQIGQAIMSGDYFVLSNFIQAEPSKETDVQPIVIFYVAVGDYEPGANINFTTSSATSAKCDATEGQTEFKVTYEKDGTWTVV